VQRILGHGSIVTTSRYTHLTTATEPHTNERIDTLMAQFCIDWGGVK
jgi:site-specific recombinase XerD